MLVLTCKVDEEVLIGGDIRIMVVSVNGDYQGRVQLGFDAPQSINIVRGKFASIKTIRATRSVKAKH